MIQFRIPLSCQIANFIREDITGPLSHQVRELFERARKRLETISHIGEDGLRRKTPEIDLEIVRELISNAITHRDYDLSGCVTVTLTSDALEVRSPGRFPPTASWSDFMSGEAPVSYPVNIAVSHYLANLLAFEGIGRGFAVFKNYVGKYGAESVTYHELPGSVTLIRVLRQKLSVGERSKLIPIIKDRVGVWGPRASGKTTFLASLYLACSNRDNWVLRAKDEGANEFVQTVSRKLTEQVFPQATSPHPSQTYKFELLHRRPKRTIEKLVPLQSERLERYTLNFAEVSGEIYEDPMLWKRAFPNIGDPMEITLSCKHIICLFDPAPFVRTDHNSDVASSTEYLSATYSLLNELRRNEPTPSRTIQSYRIAFCITKCDIPEIWERRRAPGSLAKEVFGNTLVQTIDKYVANFKWFAISAIRPDNQRPFGITEILDWLLIE